MDPTRFSTIAHREHVFCNPIPGSRIDAMLAAIVLPPSAKVLDIGSGKGELLLRVLERNPTAHATGVDTNAEYLTHALAQAKRRGVSGRLDLRFKDAASVGLGDGSFHLVACIGASHAFGTPASAIRRLATLVRRGGTVLWGEGYWRKAPDLGYLEYLGTTAEEFSDLAGTIALGVAAGLTEVETIASTPEDFDAYEGLYAGNVHRFAAAHESDPDREAMMERIDGWQDAYRRWGRDTLGFALMRFTR